MDCIRDLLPSLNMVLVPNAGRVRPLGALLRDERTLAYDKASAALGTLYVVFEDDVVRNVGRSATVACERGHDVPILQGKVTELHGL